MRLMLLAVGSRQAEWVDSACDEYLRRFPPHCKLKLAEITAGRHARNASKAQRKATEGERLLKRVPERAHVIALDEHGEMVTTRGLANRMADWLQEGRDVALLVGGPDGLAEACLQRADWRWSLSPLTLPHGLVRVIVAEQLYRAWSVLEGHPYHRA